MFSWNVCLLSRCEKRLAEKQNVAHRRFPSYSNLSCKAFLRKQKRYLLIE